MGGRPSPLSSKLIDLFLIRKRHLIAPGKNFPNMFKKYSNVIDDVTGQVKSPIWTIYHAGFVGQSIWIKFKQSLW